MMLNDGYLDACESTLILRTLATIPLLANQKEYDLGRLQPAHLCRSVRLISTRSPMRSAARLGSSPAVSSGYYTYGAKLGVIPPQAPRRRGR